VEICPIYPNLNFQRFPGDFQVISSSGEDLQRDANLLMSDFSGLKGNRVLVVTATCDCLRDEGRELAKKLEEAGVQVTALEGPGSHCVAHMLDNDFRDETFKTFISLMLPPKEDEICET
jgi:acetyl esterase/lipase